MLAEREAPQRQAGVVGSPIEHSLSPLLHRAAYRALGLHQWSYHRDEVPAGGLEAFVSRLPPSWVGLSVTMPGKEEALALGDPATERAMLTGAANTLVRGQRGWSADNTDVDGIVGSLAEKGCHRADSAWVIGSGATARSVLVALHGLGLSRVILQVQSTARAATLALAETLRIAVVVRTYDQGPPAWPDFDVAVSTVPAGGWPPPMPVNPGSAVGGHPAAGATVMDVVYQVDSPWARHLVAAGAVMVGGTDMLLYQAARQVELMTGHAAPLESMRTALASGAERRDA